MNNGIIRRLESAGTSSFEENTTGKKTKAKLPLNALMPSNSPQQFQKKLSASENKKLVEAETVNNKKIINCATLLKLRSIHTLNKKKTSEPSKFAETSFQSEHCTDNPSSDNDDDNGAFVS